MIQVLGDFGLSLLTIRACMYVLRTSKAGYLTYLDTKMLMFIECRPKHGTHDDILI